MNFQGQEKPDKSYTYIFIFYSFFFKSVNEYLKYFLAGKQSNFVIQYVVKQNYIVGVFFPVFSESFCFLSSESADVW